MADSNDIGVDVLHVGHDALAILPRLWRIEAELEALHVRLVALHYGVAAFLLKHGHREADDLALATESGDALRLLDAIRDALRHARHELSRALS